MGCGAIGKKYIYITCVFLNQTEKKSFEFSSSKKQTLHVKASLSFAWLYDVNWTYNSSATTPQYCMHTYSHTLNSKHEGLEMKARTYLHTE
jgi:hypothetical protein